MGCQIERWSLKETEAARVIPANTLPPNCYNGLVVGIWGFGMPKHICRAELPFSFNGPRWCTATAVKTARGAWRCPLHGGLSTGPRTAEGKPRIAAAARARWAAYRAEKAGSVARVATVAGFPESDCPG